MTDPERNLDWQAFAKAAAWLALAGCSAAPGAAPPEPWTRIAGENQPFTVPGTRVVRFGVDGAWIEKTVSDRGNCSNDFFGRDPAPGRGKGCDVKGKLAPAAATQAAAATGTATLSWTAPTTKADGSRLANLAGYRIYYGKTPGSYTHVATVSPSTTRYTITHLSAGTWYMTVRAFDVHNKESAASPPVSKTIR